MNGTKQVCVCLCACVCEVAVVVTLAVTVVVTVVVVVEGETYRAGWGVENDNVQLGFGVGTVGSILIAGPFSVSSGIPD